MKKSARIIIIITILISLLGGTLIQSARAESKVIYVKWDAGGSDNGASWTNAYTDLQSALSAAISGDEIWVAEGTYKPTTGTDRTVSFALKDGVAIYGGFAGTESLRSQRDFEANITILSGDLNGDDIGFTNNDENSHQVTTGSSTNHTAVLDGFTITGGNANAYPSEWGGGMYNSNGNPSLANIVFAANYAESRGGGLYNGNSSPQLTNITFNNNTAYDGGGIYNYESSPQLLNVVFDGNIAANSGGAMYNDRYSDAEITGSTFSDNTAGNSGGAVLNVESSPILFDVLFDKNMAVHGGGMHNRYESNPTLTNVVLSTNTATNTGGGIYNFQSNPVLTNVTLSNNTAVNLFGGGMYNETNSNPNLTNVTFSGNSALHGGGIYNHQGSFVQITNATFNNNIAAGDGGGINNSLTTSLSITNGTFFGNSSIDEGGAIYNGGTLTIKNGTLSNNSALEGGGMFNLGTLNIVNTIIAKTSAGGDCFSFPAIPMNIKNLVEDGSCSSEFNGDPKLGPLADNGGLTQTMALLPGSPAIDAGNNATCAATDQRGVTRPLGVACDIGAYEAPPAPKKTFRSTAAQDGWILESGETSNKGGALNKGATILQLGDNAARKQYLSILSFDTSSIPDNAVITKVTLKVKQQGITGGGNPVNMFQGFMVDIKRGSFGAPALVVSDFQAKAQKTLGPIKKAAPNGWYVLNLTPGKNFVNKLASGSGLTQIRLRFKLDDNNNNAANFLKLFSGNAPAASRPQLIVEYYVP
jgi:predicted outer membrane repeat protein